MPVLPLGSNIGATRLPVWVRVQNPLNPPDQELARLDAGESAAIAIAQEIKADLILIDERAGSAEANRRGLETTGTVGLLLFAGQLGMVNVDAALQKLATTSFRMLARLRARLLPG